MKIIENQGAEDDVELRSSLTSDRLLAAGHDLRALNDDPRALRVEALLLYSHMSGDRVSQVATISAIRAMSSSSKVSKIGTYRHTLDRG